MNNDKCTVCGMGGFWCAFDPTSGELRCANHVGTNQSDGSES